MEISVTEAKGLLDENSQAVLVIDVREPWEVEICRIDPSQTIPMRQIPERLAELPNDKRLLILCHHGARSMNVTNYLRSRGFESVSNIAGGVAAWAAELEPTMARY